jgi:hypothetical protein
VRDGVALLTDEVPFFAYHTAFDRFFLGALGAVSGIHDFSIRKK